MKTLLCLSFLMPLAVGAQAVMQSIAPAAPAARPVFSCRHALAVGGGRLHAARLLDAQGATLDESAQWLDGSREDDASTLRLSVQWHSRQGPLHFGRGMLNLRFLSQRPMTFGYELRLRQPGGTGLPLKVDAGPGYERPREATAYIWLHALFRHAEGAPALEWSLEHLTADGKRWLETYLQGVFDLAPLRAVETAMADVPAALDHLQAEPTTRCVRLP
ncbi:MAG: hypothetical protein RL026_2849 [Pseudomonadota bacterium]